MADRPASPPPHEDVAPNDVWIAVERFWCLALIPEGVDVVARVTKRVLELRATDLPEPFRWRRMSESVGAPPDVLREIATKIAEGMASWVEIHYAEGGGFEVETVERDKVKALEIYAALTTMWPEIEPLLRAALSVPVRETTREWEHGKPDPGGPFGSVPAPTRSEPSEEAIDAFREECMRRGVGTRDDARVCLRAAYAIDRVPARPAPPEECNHDWYRPMQPAATDVKRCRKCPSLWAGDPTGERDAPKET